MKMKPYEHPPALYPYREWSLGEDTYEEEHNQRSESVFALGNGYIGMRGNFEEGYHGTAGTTVAGNYLNGFYDSEPIVYPEGAYGLPAVNQSMLNVTEARIIGLEIEGHAFRMDSGKVHSFRRWLDMQTGLLHREVEWESPAGQRVKLAIRRMVCLRHKHLAAIDYAVTALNFAGTLRFESALDGEIRRPEASDDPRLGSGGAEPSLLPEDSGYDEAAGVLWMRQRTRHTRFALYTAASHRLQAASGRALALQLGGQRISAGYAAEVQRGETVILTKYITYHTSKDYPEKELRDRSAGVLEMAEGCGFNGLAEEQRAYLDQFWAHTDVEIKDDPALQQGIRFNLFQLLQSTGRDGVTNIAAKGLTGEGYEGHYFWDTEMYMLPFFTYTQPEIARKLLEFRYATLDKARERAAVLSQKGALYPWRTIDGSENSAYFPAGTAQAHINADIAYGIKQYVQVTGDVELLVSQGAEILFETSRFWADLGFFNPARGGAFCINGITGPDEYTAIVNNNAYTNLLVQDQLNYAYETVHLLKREYPSEYERLRQAIGLIDGEADMWKEAADRMFIPFDEELGIYAQDDTFLSKQKWDFEHTPADKYPLLLHFHPLVIYRHQVLKQADLVMAMFLLGDKFRLIDKIRNYQYYEPLTTHDSSLSPCIHSIISAEIGDLAAAYGYFDRTVRMDLDDINRNAKDGLHMAAMAGSWMSIVNGFGGLRQARGMLCFDPALPEQWQSFRFKVTARGRLLDVFIGSEAVVYTLLEGEDLQIRHRGQPVLLLPQQPVSLPLARQLEAVIFDLDGVITDTAELHYQAWQALADELGIPFSRAKNERLKGISRMQSLDIVLEDSPLRLTAAERLALAEKKNASYRQLLEQLTPADVLPGIPELLDSLAQRGIACGLASASLNAPLILQRLGIAGRFQAIADPAAMQKGKPDAEIFLTAAELLGVPPRSCVGVEDAAAGITAIKAAGMQAVGIGSREQLGAADLLLTSTAELTVEKLLVLFRDSGLGKQQ
ncbi:MULTISPECIES: beta-phosphoglucomutase [unclassified Paenibacillus]|uniref:beta-phosphoglucomutase n=1 Tax=unclassified Paenibacillus TaxID=185978 RepID=UPI0024060900|nr:MULTISPECIES: beta-phosphoglucomutase [unclassified Paenibacillus]MDF9839953.1 beta-phosphoglucomutase [Paenibacillus sp. PastF-2]MDF9846535.1 beta-phosphoglucomutase [Paenibacillus sp. PastM-2]MDF9853117.1 beta-phosphoglucomutase [Paenibacillus sp. PastF-1]MDH6478379.1 beta-phosphoglucomutase [Paenibacillus sp. PastH-2]MDH6506123.1 beta-phosphoglucomutase [Paenibacillus sp. PastM-3]